MIHFNIPFPNPIPDHQNQSLQVMKMQVSLPDDVNNITGNSTPRNWETTQTERLISSSKHSSKLSHPEATYVVFQKPAHIMLLSHFESAVDLDDVFLISCRDYTSWFNIQLLEAIVEKFGSEKDKKRR